MAGVENPMSSGLSPENEQFLDHVVSLGIFHDRAEAWIRRSNCLDDANSLSAT